MAPAMFWKTCKKSQKGENRSKTNDFKSKYPLYLGRSKFRVEPDERQKKEVIDEART